MKKIDLMLMIFIFIFSVGNRAFALGNRTFEKSFKAASQLTLIDKNRLAVRRYKKLLASNLTEDQRVKTMIGLARTYFQDGKLVDAINKYRDVPDGSKYWLLAKEEMAWAYTRLGQHEKAQAVLRTLMSPVLDKKVGAEVYYLNSFSALKICDFKRVFDTSSRFKNVFKQKVPILNAAIKRPGEHIRSLYMAFSNKNHQNRKENTYLFTPYSFKQSPLWQSITKKEYSPSSWEISKATESIKNWAKFEYQETRRIISLLKLAEVEAIQGMHLVENKKRRLRNMFEKVDGYDYLQFPTTENEFWLDEIDNYEVSVNDCPKFVGGHYANR